jgi:monomeric sarcosine oxidase
VPAERVDVDVVVIGAGLAGAATAWALARRGRAPLVLDAFGPGHRRGSSHGSSRIFRRAYPDPLYVRLTGRAGELWRALEEESGTGLLRVTGGLDHGRARDPERLHAVLSACGVASKLLGREEAAERWPAFTFSGPVLFHPEAGVIDPDLAIEQMRRLATAQGAEFCYGSPVVAIEASGPGAVVHTESRSVRAGVVVAAAGPWLGPLIGGHVPLPALTVTQQQAFHFGPVSGPAGGGGPDGPVFVYQDEVSVYGLPAGRDGGPGTMKVAEHDNGTVTTAGTRDAVVSAASRDRVAAFVRSHLPGLDHRPVSDLSCLYTSTASEDFILDRRGPFVICSACSGHGAKFAPLTGELAADLACGAPAPEARFTLAGHLAP